MLDEKNKKIIHTEANKNIKSVKYTLDREYLIFVA